MYEINTPAVGYHVSIFWFLEISACGREEKGTRSFLEFIKRVLTLIFSITISAEAFCQ